MTFEEFQANVIQWSTERGIYEHSTPLAQALKACSESGELCDAAIKGDIEGIKDAIGDVAVCLVNVHEMKYGSAHPIKDWSDTCTPIIGGKLVSVSTVNKYVAEMAAGSRVITIGEAIAALEWCANEYDLDFLDCCEHAWNQIKDRKGRMVAGGAFVKEEQVQ